MTSPLGDAFIEAHADTHELAPELTAGTKRAAEEAEAATRDDFVKLGEKTGETTGDNFGRTFIRDAAGRLHDAKTGAFAKESDAVGHVIGEKIGKAAGDSTESTLKKKISNLGSLLAPAWLKTIAVWVAVIAPAALQLAAVLAPAVGLLAEIIPLAVGGAASMLILKAAFNGVSQAIKDMNAPGFAKDLAKLSPSARSFVLEIKKAQPVLKALQQQIQEAFFSKIKGDFSDLINTTLPAVRRGITNIASSFGDLADAFAGGFTSSLNISYLDKILFQFGTTIHDLSEGIHPLITGLLQLGDAAVPLLDDGALAFKTFAFWFEKTIADSYHTGQLQAFFVTAESALKQIYLIGKDAWEIVSGLLDAAGKAGGGGAIIGVLTTIANVIQQLDKSGALTSVFTVFNTFFGVLGKVIGPLIGPFSEFVLLLGKELSGDLVALTPALLNLVNNGIVPLLQFVTANLPTFNSWVLAVIKLVDILTANGPLIKTVLAGFIAWFLAVKVFAVAKWIDTLATSLLEKLVPALIATDAAADANPVGALVLAVEAVIAGVILLTAYLIDLNRKTDFIGKTGDALKSAALATWHFIEDVGTAVSDFFTKTIPGYWDSFINWAEGLPARLGNALKTLAKAALEALGIEIGLALAAILHGPQLLEEALGRLAIAGAGLAKDAGLAIYHGFLDGVNGLISDFEGVIGSVINAFKAFGSQMEYAAKQTAHGIADFFEGGWKTVLSDIASIPGKIGKFGDKLFDAGVNLISRFFVGLEHGGDKIGEVAKGIYNDLKGYLNKAISAINSGINKVGHFFPGGLPNIPHFAGGAYVTSPTLALIGERAPEVVLPTDDPRKALSLLRQSGLSNVLNMGGPSFNVMVKIGDRDITDIVDTSVASANDDTAMALTHGART